MDDILEKLHLLDYMNKFCKPRKIKPFSKTYFALDQHNEDNEIKISQFVDVCYWLMTLIYVGAKLDKSQKNNSGRNNFA